MENKPISLDVLGAKVKTFFDAGKSDEAIAEILNKNVNEILMIRKLLGLQRRTWAEFGDWHHVGKDDASEKFAIWKISIPEEQAEQLGLIWGHDYDYAATCSKKEMRLEFRERPE